MQDLVISRNVLEQLNISPNELLIDIAVHLYDIEKTSIRQVKKLASLTQISFQKELSKRGVCVKYGLGELEEGLETLKLIG